jgi:uncharacterized cupredoxin-like copper-binding protein
MRTSNRIIVRGAAALAALALLAACSPAVKTASSATNQTQEVTIAMSDFKFSPEQLDVKAGQTVRFVVINQGETKHEIVFGDEQAQEEHEKLMSGGNTTHHHMQGDRAGVELDPGQTKTLEYTFPDTPGTFLYGCHEPGHWAAGMKGTVTIT